MDTWVPAKRCLPAYSAAANSCRWTQPHEPPGLGAGQAGGQGSISGMRCSGGPAGPSPCPCIQPHGGQMTWCRRAGRPKGWQQGHRSMAGHLTSSCRSRCSVPGPRSVAAIRLWWKPAEAAAAGGRAARNAGAARRRAPGSSRRLLQHCRGLARAAGLRSCSWAEGVGGGCDIVGAPWLHRASIRRGWGLHTTPMHELYEALWWACSHNSQWRVESGSSKRAPGKASREYACRSSTPGCPSEPQLPPGRGQQGRW